MRQINAETFSFASSVKEDVWHPKTSPKAYEWWYFDALSDNGKDAVVIIFLDNFIFSPRYNKSALSHSETFEDNINPQSPIPNPKLPPSHLFTIEMANLFIAPLTNICPKILRLMKISPNAKLAKIFSNLKMPHMVLAI